MFECEFCEESKEEIITMKFSDFDIKICNECYQDELDQDREYVKLKRDREYV